MTRSSARRSRVGRFDSPSSRGWAFGAGPVVPATARGPAGDVSVGAQHAAPLPGDIGSRSAPRYAEVVLPVPVPRTYAYLIPADLEPRVVPGARVVVPVQRRQVVGIVATVDAAPPASTVAVKPIAAAPDAAPAITAPLLALGLWMSRYYGAPLGLALRALLPGALWSVRRPAGPAEQVERVLTLTGALPSLLERERAFKRAPKRRVAYEALEAIGGSAPVRHRSEERRVGKECRTRWWAQHQKTSNNTGRRLITERDTQ